jgi:hypothetical protein
MEIDKAKKETEEYALLCKELNFSEFSREMDGTTKKILIRNGDFYSCWNWRKRFLHPKILLSPTFSRSYLSMKPL